MLEKVRATIRHYNLFSEGEKVIVGFSGGIDSLCLLHLLAHLNDYRLVLWAVYINHCLRPAENIMEERLLDDIGQLWGIQTRKIILNIPERLQQKPQSLQLLAREERYRIFLELREEIGASKVALAHHRDDQAETVLYRIIRGTGIEGLAGIPVAREGFIVRPLMQVSRNEISAYAAEHNLQWVEDSSNQKMIYRRNRIRRQLIPEIEKDFNPRFKDALVRLSELAAEQSDFVESLVSENLKTLRINGPERTGLRLEQFLELHPYLQYALIKRILSDMDRGYHLESYRLKRVLSIIRTEKHSLKLFHIHQGIAVYYEKGNIYFEPGLSFTPKNFWIPESHIYPVNIPGETWIPMSGLKLNAEQTIAPKNWGKVNLREAYLDINKLKLPAMIRYWRPGDSFRPLGISGNQKLQDFFMNLKVPRSERNRIPLLVDCQGRIAWIIGYRLSEDFKVRDLEAQAWHITVTVCTPI